MAPLILLMLPLQGAAQDTAATASDRGYLTSLLESNLSGMGRSVTIDGFAGAFSSRATFTQLTIADGDGVWITIHDGAISWNRSALLSGRIEIAELSAGAIDLVRAPHNPDAAGSSVSARSFSLPELPVAVDIASVKTDRLTLGPSILGEVAAVTIQGSAKLEGGEGATDFSIHRVDGKKGDLTLKASFANTTRVATVDLLAEEGAGGVAAALLGLPGKPSAQLALHGSGPIDSFSTDLALATGGTPRLTGNVTLSTTKDASGADERRFLATFQGDVSPLLKPDYREFFGHQVSLQAEGVQHADQRLDLTRLVLDSDAVSISGRVGLSAEKIPLAAVLTMRFGLAGKDRVLLPFPGTPTYVRNGLLRLRFDAAKGNDWQLSGDLSGFARDGVDLAEVTLDGSGKILQPDRASAVPAQVSGSVGFAAKGLHLASAAVNAAIGPDITGRTGFSWQEGQPLSLSGLGAQAGDMALTGDMTIRRDGLDLAVDGAMTAKVPDITRFSALSGRKLGGAADFRIAGSGHLLSGAFDMTASAAGNGLSIDQPMVDRLLAQGSQIDVSAVRDQTGITLRNLLLDVAALHAQAAGTIRPDGQDLTASMTFSDLGALGTGLSGSLKAEATLAGAEGQRQFRLSGSGTGLRSGVAAVDPLLVGRSTLDLEARESKGGVSLTRFDLANPQITAHAEGAGADGELAVAARIANMAVVVPGFPGAVTLSGHVAQTADSYALTLRAGGPGNTDARLGGTISTDLSHADLTLTGGGQSAVANALIAPRSIDGPLRFDLRMAGPLALSSVSGKISVSALRLASPSERLSIDGGSVVATLGGGSMQVSGSGSLRGGGSVKISGPVGLVAPYTAALAITLDHAHLHDPSLYDTTLTGRVNLTGPLGGGALISGAVTLDETEISVASASFDDTTAPVVSHVNEPASVRDTRARAGLAGTDAATNRAAGPVYQLDFSVAAPARFFVRGRGLDAEMSGTVHLRGTTADIQPSGHFDLRRGRLNLLGKRFVLDQGVVQLLGSFVPYIDFSASTDSFGVTSTISVEGPANAPKLHFTSTSGVPEEEVISQLLFGNGLDNISAFQLAQLASAVATLTGHGGEGIVTRLRKSFKLDDLDVIADDQGNAGLKAGKYLTDKVYSEATVGSDGKSQIQLNYDLNPDTTLRGTAGTSGTSGVGIFYNHDY